MHAAVTVHAALMAAARILAQFGAESAWLEASLLLAHRLDMERGTLLLSPEKILDSNQIEDFRALVARRAQHEPIAYITGKKEFWSLDFTVTRDTLIPRPESETLVEAALKRMRNKTSHAPFGSPVLLDIGTGTGCLLIALLKEFPAACGIGLDNNERALQVARKNANRHVIDDRALFVQSHWCDALQGTFDLILSNPPYIADGAMDALMPDVREFEPHGALAAGVDGLDAYRDLAPQVAAKLNPGGYVLFEVGQGQAPAVERLLREQGLVTEETEKDLAGIPRCVSARKTG